VVSAIVSKAKGSTDLSIPGGGAKVPRIARLLRHADFERVYKQGKRHFATHMTVFYLRRAEGAGTASGIRIGFTVGRALGGAVDRNRMKRRLREAVRLQVSVPNVAVDVVINPKKSLRTTEFANLQNEVRRAFETIEKHVTTAAEAVSRELNK
jgi:ribonuclease P protein component